MSRVALKPPPGQLENASADSLQLNTIPPAIPEVEGLLKWNPDDFTLDIVTGLGTVIPSGQRLVVFVKNISGVDINIGDVTYVTGSYSERPTVAKANADSFETINGAIGVAITDILNNGSGLVADFGTVKPMDTSSFQLQKTLWVAAGPGQDGKMTNVKPSFPNYAIQIGQATYIDAVNGTIALKIDQNANDTTINFWNGTIRESFNFLITSNGIDVIGSLSPNGSQDNLTLIFSDGLTKLIAKPDITIALVPGTDNISQLNYVYIPISTKLLTVSTSDWPSEEHVKIGSVYLRSASKTQTDGALKNHNHNDEIQSSSSNMGHLSHIGEAIREKIPATYISGISVSVSGTPTNVYVSTTSGVVRLFHRHTFPAQSMPTDDIHIVNHPTNNFLTVTNLNGQTSDSLGSTLVNSSFSLVLWGVQNKTNEKSHLMINLPNGKYSRLAPQDALNDPTGYAVYTIPKEFNGVGFLIARFIFQLASNGTDWTLYATQDLRGFLPNNTAGSGAGSSGITSLTGLTDTPSTLIPNGVLRVNGVGTALDFTSAIKLPGLKSGATQVGAGAAADEIWKTSGHATLPDNVLMIGI